MKSKKHSNEQDNRAVLSEGIVDLLKENLTESQINESMIFLDASIRPKGEKLEAGRGSVTYPFEGFMVFVDLAPQANWTHECLYLFVSSDLKLLKRIPGKFPPYFGTPPPESYTLLLRYGLSPDDARDFNPFNS